MVTESTGTGSRGSAAVTGCMEIDDLTLYPGPMRESIARLSDNELTLMTRRDLLDMIRLSRVMLQRESHGGLEWAGDHDLRTMAHAVRTCCRNHLGAFHQRLGNNYAWE